MATYPRPPLPRLHFTGRFFADPSTINNDVTHFDTDAFRPNFQLPGDSVNRNGRNPEGTGAFALISVTPTSIKAHSTTHFPTDPGLPPDPLLTRRISGNDRSVQAKIVDLDPQMQTVSQIWGLRMRAGTEDTGFAGLLHTMPFRDLWGSLDGVPGMPGLSAVYQGVLKLNSFSAGESSFLKECAPFVEQSKKEFPGGALSVRFRVSGFTPASEDNDFRYGAVTGMIQPWLLGEPLLFDAGRALRPPPVGGAMTAYAHVQQDDTGSALYIDLVNSLVRDSETTFKDVGSLYVVILSSGGASSVDEVDMSGTFELGKIEYLSKGWLENTGGIAEIPLTEAQRAEVESKPLAVVAVKDGENTVLLREERDGCFARADDYVYRLNPAQKAKCNIYVTKFGQRAAHATVSVGLDSTSMQGSNSPKAGVPESGLTINGDTPKDSSPNDFVTKLTTDANGVAVLSILGGDAKNSREYVDGQMYGLRYGVGDKLRPLRPRGNPSEKINVLLFDKFTAPDKPSWIVDILPIFKQYANLYPSMDRIVSLDDYGSCVNRLTPLARAFGARLEDPHYMPVTRDMSTAKREMILKWLGSVDKEGHPLYMNITRKEDVMAALQTAIELEHATLPPYLCALYSIKQGYNQFVSDAIQDVVMEEMLHFALACNILISIGGRPNINKIGFVPKYPGPLPGGLRRGLILRLRKCSIEQLRAFMSLEAPERQITPDQKHVDDDDDVQLNKYTIGFLYDKIKESLRALHACGEIKFPCDKPHSSDSDNLKFQVSGWTVPGKLVKITSLQEALDAIDLIKEQGEGASPTMPTDGAIDPTTGLLELSHYFRFAEIVKGRRIVVKNRSFSYTGERIVLNKEGVYNMQDDPNVRFLPVGSQARDRLESFSRKYQAMLNGLHVTFNGQPEYLTQAVALMFQLTISAKPLMEMPALELDGSVKKDGTTVGISFQMPFTD